MLPSVKEREEAECLRSLAGLRRREYLRHSDEAFCAFCCGLQELVCIQLVALDEFLEYNDRFQSLRTKFIYLLGVKFRQFPSYTCRQRIGAMLVAIFIVRNPK